MGKYLFIMLLILFTLSCTEEESEMPASVLPMNEMVNMMIDVHLLESTISSENLLRDSGMVLNNLYKKDVYRKYKITDSIYKINFDYYSSHPALLDKVYESVVDSLSLREERMK